MVFFFCFTHILFFSESIPCFGALAPSLASKSEASNYRNKFIKALLFSLHDTLTPSIIQSGWKNAGLYDQTSMDSLLRSLPSIHSLRTLKIPEQDFFSSTIITSTEIIQQLQKNTLSSTKQIDVERSLPSENNENHQNSQSSSSSLPIHPPPISYNPLLDNDLLLF